MKSVTKLRMPTVQKRISINIDPETAALIKKHAGKDKRSISNYLVTLITQWAKEEEARLSQVDPSSNEAEKSPTPGTEYRTKVKTTPGVIKKRRTGT